MSYPGTPNFSAPPPFLTNSQALATVSVQNDQNVYQFPPPPTMPPPPVFPPEQFISPPPFIASRFISPMPTPHNLPPWNQYSVQTSQHFGTPQLPSPGIQQGIILQSTDHEKLTKSRSNINGNISEDQNWVHDWLRQKKIGEKNSDWKNKRNENTEIKIYEARSRLSVAINIIKELENASATLNVMMKTVTDIEWEEKCQEIDKKKEELSQILHTLKMDPMDFTEIKKKLKKRKAKRDRLKRRNLKRKAERIEQKEKREKLHQQIDSWLEEMKASVERNRREEELKREADSVLWEVTQKKAEARKQITLLTSLLQLRDAKAKALKSSGKYVSESEITTFNTVIEKLKTMWEKQLEGYLLDEQGLRVMLTEDAEKKNTNEVNLKQVLQQWEAAIFGSKFNDTSGEPCDLQELIEIRHAWDRFVTSEKTVMASAIPIGWVLPTKPSDESWAKSLKHGK